MLFKDILLHFSMEVDTELPAGKKPAAGAAQFRNSTEIFGEIERQEGIRIKGGQNPGARGECPASLDWQDKEKLLPGS